MARIVDSEGKLLGGIELSFARLLAPLHKQEKNLINAPADTPEPPIFGPKEDVRWLVCSYGALPTVVYSTLGSSPDSRFAVGERERCQNQVDKPHKRHYCPNCGGYYCVTHAEPDAHDCKSVMQLKVSSL